MNVITLRYHTFLGVEHQPGDVYEIEDQHLGNLQGQGMAQPTDATPAPVTVDEPVTSESD